MPYTASFCGGSTSSTGCLIRRDLVGAAGVAADMVEPFFRITEC
jgi:hypothetical protein